MTKFSEFLESQNSDKQKPVEAEIVEGSFGCQICSECMDEAEYFHIQKVLKWKCGAGHISFIEGFTL